MDGDVVDLDLVPDQPVHDVADHPPVLRTDDDHREGDPFVLDLAPEGGVAPGIGEGQGLDLVDGGEVRVLHPPQMEDSTGREPRR